MSSRSKAQIKARTAYHVLNMGRTKFGDCIVVEIAGKTILIDGGHPGDWHDGDDRPSIPRQLGTIFASEPPFHFDLLIVTHCHLDHIGCLPKLVADGTISCDRALVADEKLGFGLDVSGGEDSRLEGASSDARTLVAALTEEDHSSLQDADLEEFLIDAATLAENYKSMLDKLGSKAVRYRQGTAAERRQVADIVKSFSKTGLVIFGPTSEQLAECAEALRRASGSAADIIGNATDNTTSLPELYRQLMANPSDDLDAIRSSAGAAKNCQSIVLAFGSAGQRVLLPGDMQFAKPGLSRIEDLVGNLRQAAAAHGPYAFVKLPHHSSDNGVDEAMLHSFGWPPLLVHSGGYNDPIHPNPATLKLLSTLKRNHEFAYGRTDRNGLLTIEIPNEGGARFVSLEQGRLNDFTPNSANDEREGETYPPAEFTGEGRVLPPEEAKEPNVILERDDTSFVEVTFVRIPYQSGRVSINGNSIDIARPKKEPAAEKNDPPDTAPRIRRIQQLRSAASQMAPPSVNLNQLAGGRALPKLVFVTDPDRLAHNIGDDAARALEIVRSSGQTLVLGRQTSLPEIVRRSVKLDHKGVVILGGYDVVPSQRVDVLDTSLRTHLPPSLIAKDPDAFVVWSDDVYGDKDNDGIAELPVSRIPDARVASFFIAQLLNGAVIGTGRFGLRNSARPFADDIFDRVPGTETIRLSEPITADRLNVASIAKPNVYFMLHGHYSDGASFWGEDGSHNNIVAVNTAALPHTGIGVVFAGCCWGALSVSEPAFLGTGPTPRMVERSIALLMLKAGARCFVGTTGVHYSPVPAGDFFGGPMHRAFWQEITRGTAPAEALFNARKEFLAAMPHGRSGLFDLAVERKIYKQFTCLGLGW